MRLSISGFTLMNETSSLIWPVAGSMASVAGDWDTNDEDVSVPTKGRMLLGACEVRSAD